MSKKDKVVKKLKWLGLKIVKLLLLPPMLLFGLILLAVEKVFKVDCNPIREKCTGLVCFIESED